MKVGDAVWAVVIQKGPKGATLGAYAEYVVTKESKVSFKPTNLSFEEAGAMPLAGLTALQCLRAVDTAEGSAVLVLGGSGATGSAGIQIAKAMGAKVYTTCSTRNMEYVKSLGPDEVIDYTKQDWAEVLKGKNLDGAFDSVGENDGINRAVGILKAGGKVSTIAGAMPTEALPNGITAKFIMTNSQSVEDLDYLKGLCEESKLKMKIEKTYPFEKVAEAFQVNMAGKSWESSESLHR